MRRAGNWAIVTLTPGQLPATAMTATYLGAANDLEQTGQQQAAHAAYQAAVEAWPAEVTAWLALGNLSGPPTRLHPGYVSIVQQT